MNPYTSLFSTKPLPSTMAPSAGTLNALYLRLLSPDENGLERFRQVKIAASTYAPGIPGSQTALEQLFSRLVGMPVRLSEQQLHAFKRLAGESAFNELLPWKAQGAHQEHEEMVSASDLHDIYLALLKPDGGHMKRLKTVQASAAVYEPNVPNSRAALEQELSQLIGRPVQLNETQARCFKELLIDEPAFAHIAPWEELTAIW